ncbi:LysM peptidoglycan-binding domain-containing protein [Thermodesulfobacteriota bacterium]
MKKTCLAMIALLYMTAAIFLMAQTICAEEGEEMVQGKVYIVKPGDSLWDIATEFYDNPYKWRELWSGNLKVTNPHWIFPGDSLYLHPVVERPFGADIGEMVDGKMVEGQGIAKGTIEDFMVQGADIDVSPEGMAYLKKIWAKSFLEVDEVDGIGSIVASDRERTLLTQGDPVYVKFYGEQPSLNEKFVVFGNERAIIHPKTKKNLGKMVSSLAEIRITEVHEESCRANITYSNDPLTVGDKVMPIEDKTRELTIKQSGLDRKGYIVAADTERFNYATNDIVIIDLGAADGIETGNLLQIYKKGETVEDPNSGKNVKLPERVVGRTVVIETGENTSVALILQSLEFLQAGELVRLE